MGNCPVPVAEDSELCHPTTEIGSVMKHDLMGHGRFGQYARIDVIVEVLMQILKTK